MTGSLAEVLERMIIPMTANHMTGAEGVASFVDVQIKWHDRDRYVHSALLSISARPK